jgi:hypothetical protein
MLSYMPRGEQEPPQGGNEELAPFELPDVLAEFLAAEEYAMVTSATNLGTVYVVKVPGADIQSMAGQVPIEVRHQLYQHPLAPVIRTVVRVYDQPSTPLALESFINVADEHQWAEFADLSECDHLTFLFYDDRLQHRLTKQVRNGVGEQIRDILNWADRAKAAIREDQYDFDQAKADVIRRTSMGNA